MAPALRRHLKISSGLVALVVLVASVFSMSGSTNATSAIFSPGGSSVAAFVLGPGFNGSECDWYEANQTFLGEGDFGSLMGLGSGSITIQFKAPAGIGSVYMLDFAALVCNVPTGVSDFQVYVNATASTPGSGANWIVATLQGGSPGGYTGALNSSPMELWRPGAGAGTMPNDPSRDPLSNVACDSTAGGLHVPYNGWDGSGQIPQTWSYAVNGTTQWTQDECTQGHAGPPGLPVTASPGTTDAFYFLSMMETNISAAGVTGSPSLTLTAASNPWLSTVAISPSSALVPANLSVAFAATATCTDGNCPGIQAYWSLTNHLGKLSTAYGSPVTFTAGPYKGEVTLFANVTVDGMTMERSVVINIVLASTGPGGILDAFLNFMDPWGWIIVGAVAAVTIVALVVAVAAGRKRHIGYAPPGLSMKNCPHCNNAFDSQLTVCPLCGKKSA
jgi:hypothetical protein